ncbi:SusC/RagA family TonB-linked outer membrane protein [Aestuariivivens sediminicola]|uniref:SusC/RagA family TonB-linked outer membrane protein n=1 Tax=Aestuariivivens sediminicola TaxID=2913560 RepID=UPI001F5AD3E0|nr:TonB-dependent receptor [Aestuariivivens sediminicola]
MKTLLVYVLLLIPLGPMAFAQNAISGTVTDESGFPLAGANIIEKGTSNGAQTDFDGNYALTVSNNAVLVVSYLGYLTKEVAVSNQTTINIVLQEDIASLDEVVVVGYGTQKKVDLTSSVQSVSFREEVNQPVTNSGQLLYGRFSGVQLNQTSGNPGADGSSIVIRGIGTFGGTLPLIVIDNIQYDDLAAFNSLSPADIESISVLKDASAGAIYGARGANGVILVTTRRGTEDKFEINYNSYYGFQEATVTPEFLESYDYAILMNEKFRNEDGPGFLPRYTTEQLEAIRTGSLPDQFANTNWADEVLRTASITSHNLSFSGGSAKTTFRVSLGYLGQDAIVKSKFKNERYNISFNINSKLKEWFTLSSVTNTFWRRIEGPTGGQNAFSGDNGIIYNFQRSAPTIPLFYSNGQYGVVDGAWENSNASFLTQNPLRRGYLGNYINDQVNISQRIGMTFQLSENLSFETSGSANIVYTNTSDFTPVETLFSFDGTPVIVGTLNNLDNGTDLDYTLLNENVLKYNKTFSDKHNVGALIGHSASYFRTDNFAGTLSGFPTNNIEEFNGGGIVNPAVQGGAAEDVLQSFFGRFNYDYEGKYFAQFSFRRDGTSRFGLSNLYGNFPSASVGWRISEEKFMDKADVVNNLKLRASWGISGNNRIGRYIYEQTYNPDQDYVLGADVNVVGVAVTGIANPNIRWEETEQYDIGLDLSLFKNKVEFVADYFNRDSQDILYDNFPIPNTLGVTNLGAINAASMINRGLEMALNYRGNLSDNVKFSVGANMTKFLKNEVTGLGDGGEETITNTTIIRIGEPFRSYYGLKAIGVFQSLEEIANAPTQFGNINTAPGDLRYADVSGPDGVPDGVVDDDDRTIIGNPNPDLLVNFNGSLELYGFDFNFMFQGVSGVDRLLMGNGNLPMRDDRSNVLKYWINRWTPENPSINLPRVGGQNNDRVSSFYIQDASYLRLKSVELGYSVPTAVLDKIGMTKLRVYLGAQNLLTFTGLEYFDPEGGIGNQSNRNVPLYKTITFGINAKL